jgi:hypothetical protein
MEATAEQLRRKKLRDAPIAAQAMRDLQGLRDGLSWLSWPLKSIRHQPGGTQACVRGECAL